jgi:hypothetical protein
MRVTSSEEVTGVATTVGGVVKEGRVVPDSPLPEGARVEIVLPDQPPSVPPELQAEADAWDRASAEALGLVERLVSDGKANEARG